MLGPTPRCHAHARSGAQCQHYAMRGQTVCHMHGGKSPQALAAAEARLRALEFPAIQTLADLIEHADMDSVRLQAARWLLELLGHKPSDQVQASGTVKIEVEYIGRTAALDGTAPRIIDVPSQLEVQRQVNYLNGHSGHVTEN